MKNAIITDFQQSDEKLLAIYLYIKKYIYRLKNSPGDE